LEIGELDERYRRPGPTESRTALRNTLEERNRIVAGQFLRGGLLLAAR
jgi:hypothetical protein